MSHTSSDVEFTPGYWQMNVRALKSLLRQQGLPLGGRKGDMVERLEARDLSRPVWASSSRTHWEKTMRELKLELAERNLKRSGNKTVLIHRLELWRKENIFRFMDLPGEIRGIILKMLCQSSNIGLPRLKFSSLWPTSEHNKKMFQKPALFETCRRLRLEGFQTFFTHRHLHFIVKRHASDSAQYECLHHWIVANSAIAASHLKLLRITMLDTPSLREQDKLFEILQRLQGMKVKTIVTCIEEDIYYQERNVFHTLAMKLSGWCSFETVCTVERNAAAQQDAYPDEENPGTPFRWNYRLIMEPQPSQQKQG